MDIDLFRDGEQFSTFDTHNFLDHYPDDSSSLDGVNSFSRNNLYEWDLEHEREINGDLALIPVASNFCQTMNTISESPPSKEDFQKIMNEWQQLISIDSECEEFPIEDPIISPEENNDETAQQKNSPLHEILNLPCTNMFDIASYLNEDEPKPENSILVRKPKAGVKKIDLKAQRYIVEEDEVDVDVETISECENSPVLEAGDLNSLLEQFEATEMPELPAHLVENNADVKVEKGNICIKKEPMDTFTESAFVDNSIKCKKEVVKVKKEPVDTESFINNKDFKVDVNIKKEPKHELYGVNKERKPDIRNEICKVEECKPVKMELKELKVEHAKPHVKKEDKTLNPPKIVTQMIQTPIKQPPKEIPSHEIPPQKRPKHETNPNHLLPPPNPPTTANSPESTTSSTLDPTKNKQIMDALPQELIDRIKESGKRKTISVIPPIPSKKRGGPRMQEANAHCARNKLIKLVMTETVQLDHDYCSSSSPYPKHPKKDSGFESAEEDDRPIMRKQPMVKNADGKLMVSLLKVNTIRTDSSQKRKLNLEEYKKRREGFLKFQGSPQNSSPASSSCSSPILEDENTKRIKHQEKLMKMAMEVLNTPPKSERKSEIPLVITPPQPLIIPSDMEKKTLVSIGVNTDFKICKNMNPVTPVEQLEEIKPLLKKASAKINCNSLITSLIENIPKVINQSEHQDLKTNTSQAKPEHGEDKTIVYLPKNRTAIKTTSVEVQTNISLIQQSKQSRYRRRRDSSTSSSSSCASRHSRTATRFSRRRKNSDCSSGRSRSSKSSRSSRSGSYSSYSSRSSSRSRSRSTSPRYSRKERERLREVEERRVIYVGRISSNTSRDDLRKRFQRFGPITNVSLHFRDHGDNYGFVTFANKLDAYEAIEHGNDDPYHPKYDLSFGGRRIFCKTSYSDLDNMRDETTYFSPRVVEDSFDTLLREAQEKLRKRKA